MSNLNPRTIDTVSIKEVKELDEFLKAYYNHEQKDDAERKSAVIEELKGKVTDSLYDELLERSKTYTKTSTIPTSAEWSQVRVVYREIGNQKIAQSKDRLEKASKAYNGTQSVEDEVYGNITPAQAVKNLEKTQKKVEVYKNLKVITTLILGVAGFVLLTLVSKLLVSALGLDGVVLQIIAGVFVIVGVLCGTIIGVKLMGAVEHSAKVHRDIAERTESKYHDQIVKLQTEIKTAEELKNRIESQYGVEIFAQTNFTGDVVNTKPVKPKKEKTLKQKEAKKQPEMAPKEEQPQEVPSTVISTQSEQIVEKQEKFKSEETLEVNPQQGEQKPKEKDSLKAPKKAIAQKVVKKEQPKKIETPKEKKPAKPENKKVSKPRTEGNN